MVGNDLSEMSEMELHQLMKQLTGEQCNSVYASPWTVGGDSAPPMSPLEA